MIVDILYRILYDRYMTTTLPITKARDELPTLVADANKRWGEYEITVYGVPMAVLISKAQYDSWKETDDIIGDPQLVGAIREAEEDVQRGRVYDWEDVKRKLNIDVQNKTNRKSNKRVKRNLQKS